MKKIILCCIGLIWTGLLLAQAPTIGLLSYDPDQSFDGYNLFYPHGQADVFLLNNCGEIVHRWVGEADYHPGNTAYLTESGQLIKTSRMADVVGDPIWAGGGGEKVEVIDWENNSLASFSLNNGSARVHHDIAVMPNGNVLMIAWELKTYAESIQAGRDSALLAQVRLWPDYVFEWNPTIDEVVWEWHAWDHLIQDYDDTKDNYGVVAEHPELINLNWDTNNAKADWLHCNALDYNPDLDQIIIGVPNFHEVWIIDHSTTTAEAAGSTGGNSGKGGDLLYRWGNPAAYNQGTADDQKLFYPHDAHWARELLDETHPNYGQIAVFNNKVGIDYSTVNLWTPPLNVDNGTYLSQSDVFLPQDFDQTIEHPDQQALFSTAMSGFQVLPNSNYLICDGRHGYMFELTPDNDVVWEYKNPMFGGIPGTQGDIFTINQNLVFRFVRYPMDYPAFEGKELEPMGYIELKPDTAFCALLLPTEDPPMSAAVALFPNPSQGLVHLDWEDAGALDIEVIDVLGARRIRIEGVRSHETIDLTHLENGVYFLQLGTGHLERLIIHR